VSSTCPDCAKPLQPLFVDLPGKADVPLDRCAQCGGLWFDFGELEAVTGRSAPFEPLDGAGTDRRCPRCTLSLSPGLLDGSIPVETCTACRGLWLDFADLPDVRAPRLAALARPPEGPGRYEGLAPPDDDGPVEIVGFTCAACQKRAPYAQARGTARGLVCSACSPEVQPMPRAPNLDHVDMRPGLVKVLDLFGPWRRR
jgi:Zn-finger nucleic acid-binding protein